MLSLDAKAEKDKLVKRCQDLNIEVSPELSEQDLNNEEPVFYSGRDPLKLPELPGSNKQQYESLKHIFYPIGSAEKYWRVHRLGSNIKNYQMERSITPNVTIALQYAPSETNPVISAKQPEPR